MSAKDLRSKVIRLAHQKPELRKHLLPLVTKSSRLNKVSSKINVFSQMVVDLFPTYKADYFAGGSDAVMVQFRGKGTPITSIHTHLSLRGGGVLTVSATKNRNREIGGENPLQLILSKETQSSAQKKIMNYLKSL